MSKSKAHTILIENGFRHISNQDDMSEYISPYGNSIVTNDSKKVIHDLGDLASDKSKTLATASTEGLTGVIIKHPNISSMDSLKNGHTIRIIPTVTHSEIEKSISSVVTNTDVATCRIMNGEILEIIRLMENVDDIHNKITELASELFLSYDRILSDVIPNTKVLRNKLESHNEIVREKLSKRQKIIETMYTHMNIINDDIETMTKLHDKMLIMKNQIDDHYNELG